MSADKYEQNLVIRQEYAELEARYSSLLAVLRWCMELVTKWEQTDDAGGGCPGCQGRTEALRSALSAARPWLEERR